jgi:hypothetical protein
VVGWAPRAPGDSVRPRHLSGVFVRPLNFTVRRRRRKIDELQSYVETGRMKSGSEQRSGGIPSFAAHGMCGRGRFPPASSSNHRWRRP